MNNYCYHGFMEMLPLKSFGKLNYNKLKENLGGFYYEFT